MPEIYPQFYQPCKTVYGLIKETLKDLEDYHSYLSVKEFDPIVRKLKVVIDAIDNGGSLETVVIN